MPSERIDYEDLTLDNGLRVITVEDPAVPIAAVQLWYGTGSRNDPPQRRGFAHMFEHMMFRGTERLGPQDHFNFIRGTGGECNAYTGFDQTVYVQDVPSTQVELALWLESERMAFLSIDSEGFDTERQVVAEEYRAYAEAPYGTVLERLLPDLLPGHPYGTLPIGSMADLAASSVQDLEDFWQKHYVPGNATLVVVGDVEHRKVQDLARHYFGWMPAGPAKSNSWKVKAPTGPRSFKIREKSGPAPLVALAYTTVPASHEDSTALEMIAGILGGSEGSRVYRKLVTEKNLAIVAGASGVHMQLDGVLALGAILSPIPGKRKRALRALRREVKLLRDEGPTDEELLIAKNNMLRDEILSRFSVSSRAQSLGTAAVIEERLEGVNDSLDEIRAVSREDLQSAAQKYLVPEREMEILVKPNLLGFIWQRLRGSKPAPTPQAASSADNGVRREPLERPNHLADAPPVGPPARGYKLPEIQERRLSNGMRVAFVENHDLPYVTFHVGMLHGAWTDPDGAPGTAHMAAALLTSGTASMDHAELTRELDRRAITIQANVDLDAGSVSAGAVREEAPRALEILAELFRQPTFPKDRFLLLQKQLKTGRAIADRDPGTRADRAFRERLFKGHPYARTAEGEREDVARLDLDLVRSWWANHVTPESCILYIAGDLKSTDVEQMAESVFGDWQVAAGSSIAQPQASDWEQVNHVHLLDHRGHQAQIRVGHPTVGHGSDHYFATLCLNQILGGGFNSRLNTTIRVEKGLTYGVQGGVSFRRFGGELRVNTFTRTERAAETVEAILEELQRLKTEPPTAMELAAAQSYLCGNFVLQRETPEAIIGDHWFIEHMGLPRDHFDRYLEAIQNTTVEDVAAAAEALVREDALSIVVVGRSAELREALTGLTPVMIA